MTQQPAHTGVDRALESATRVLHAIGAATIGLLTVVILYDAFGRLLFNRPFPGTTELAANAMVLITFLQMPYAILHGKLLRVTFLYDRLPRGGRAVLNALAFGVGAAFFAAIAAMGWAPLVHSIQSGEFYGTNAFRIAAWPLRGATFLLWLAAAAVCLRLVWLALTGRFDAPAQAAH